MTMVQSHNTTLLDPGDFTNIQNNAYPIVFAYNGRDHFSPTMPVSPAQYIQWKTEKELGSLLGASLHVMAGLDFSQVPEGVCNALNEVQSSIARNLQVISKTGLALYKKKQDQAPYQGPSVHQPPGPVVPARPAPPSLPQSEEPPPATPGTSSAGSSAAGAAKKKGREGFTCAECGVIKYRRPDFEGHLWWHHGLGEPIVCNRGNCQNRSFSCKSSLTQHVRNQHEKVFKYSCPDCLYGSDSWDCITSHRVNKHKHRFVNKKGKRVVFTCPHCNKEFVAAHLLKKHVKSESCTTHKTLKCPKCTRLFKSKEGLDRHISNQHQGKKSPCPTCGLMIAAKSMANHLKKHASQRAVQRAKDFAAKRGRRKTTFQFSSDLLQKRKVRARKKSAASKSAPAKLKRSPRKPKRKGK